MYFIKDGSILGRTGPEAESVQQDKGESMAHVRSHLTLSSSCMLWPEYNAHSYFCWPIDSSSKSLGMVSLISEKQSGVKVFCESGLFVGNGLSTQNGSCICFPCRFTISIIFLQHFIKSFNQDRCFPNQTFGLQVKRTSLQDAQYLQKNWNRKKKVKRENQYTSSKMGICEFCHKWPEKWYPDGSRYGELQYLLSALLDKDGFFFNSLSFIIFILTVIGLGTQDMGSVGPERHSNHIWYVDIFTGR